MKPFNKRGIFLERERIGRSRKLSNKMEPFYRSFVILDSRIISKIVGSQMYKRRGIY